MDFKGGCMKLKEYKSFCDLLTKELKRKMFPFNDFGEAQRIKLRSNVLQFPVIKTYKQKKN